MDAHEEKVEHSLLLEPVSSDDRRDIREVNFSDSAWADFLIKDGSKPLGQHFHRKKFEIFHFLHGGGKVRTAKVDADGKTVGEVQVIQVGPGSIIRIPSMHAHRFDLAAHTRFIGFSSSPFDGGDMIPCPIKIE